MIQFFTDPHLGRNASSHTTVSSRNRLDDKLFSAAITASHSEYPVVCLGDLFHKAHNHEKVISQGMSIASRCTLLLEGNHDLTNRTDSVPSMAVLSQSNLEDTKIVSCSLGKAAISVTYINNTKLVAIPHHMNQELFEVALDLARKEKGDLLLLHCNYNSPFVSNIDTALNLTEDKAKELIDSFDYIVLGHEHIHRWELDGKVLVLGNTHPTSFADISNKYSWVYDEQDKSWTKKVIWSKLDHHIEVDFHKLIEDSPTFDQDIEFVDVVGQLSGSDDAYRLSKAISKLWETHEHLLMIRNHTSIEAADELEGNDFVSFSNNLRDIILDSVRGTHMEEPYKQYVKEASND